MNNCIGGRINEEKILITKETQAKTFSKSFITAATTANSKIIHTYAS